MTEAVWVAIVGGTLLVVAGIAVLSATIAAASGTLGRQKFIGARNVWTLKSDEAWQVGHQAALRRHAIGAVPPILLGVIYLFGARVLPAAPGVLAGGLFWLFAFTLNGCSLAKSAARRL